MRRYNPWRSPGKAPVRDPCGAASGYVHPSPYATNPAGYEPWAEGSKVLPVGNVTVWKAGGVAEVAWSIAAQHGGGYTYRLCPKKPAAVLSEECFQANPLSFVGKTHTIRFNDGSKPDFSVNATQLTTGVTPAGSTWRRNPIPACSMRHHTAPRRASHRTEICTAHALARSHSVHAMHALARRHRL